ncbi:MAG TPA: hypothetical protein VE078_09655, partial [Thermoanaerobaculia bacterium]|nr:hypothetical protein [Thermoanaerobaculia bacterium]
NLGTQYTHTLVGRWLAIGRIDVERRGRQYWHADNLDVQDPFALVNLRLSLEMEAWSVAAWAKNLTNESYYVEYSDMTWLGNITAGDIGQLGRPRTVGIEVRRTF